VDDKQLDSGMLLQPQTCFGSQKETEVGSREPESFVQEAAGGRGAVSRSRFNLCSLTKITKSATHSSNRNVPILAKGV